GWSQTATLRSEPANLEPITGEKKDCADGSADLFECSRVDLISFLPVQALGGARGVMVNDLWGWTDLTTEREYVLQGRTDGTSFIDITDPSNPVYLGQLPLTEGAQPAVWRDIKVYKDHAFIVADNSGEHGVQVFDLTRLRDVANVPATFDEDAVYRGINSAHNIAIDEESGFAYTTGNSGGGETCGGGLHMIDIRDPKNPEFAGCFSHEGTGYRGTGYTHDAQCVLYRGPDADYQGREICFSANENALSIGDVTDKSNVKYISQGSYPNSAYVHQGWLTEDHRYFYINDEGDEVSGNVDQTRTLIWDVSDLDDPQLSKEYMWGSTASDHNLYVRGNLMYQSNYVSGLRVHDISDPVNPKEVGYFDTVPVGGNGPGFAGSWSNYPYFKSEVIAVSSMQEGLFLVKKQSEPGL
ncbi:MAG: choice-of-anchor B family protein, partial [Rhodothermales bacterium]